VEGGGVLERRKVKLGALSILAVLFAACGDSSELTSESAEELIRAHERDVGVGRSLRDRGFPGIRLNGPMQNRGVREGLWTQYDRWTVDFSEKGKELFRGAAGTESASVNAVFVLGDFEQVEVAEILELADQRRKAEFTCTVAAPEAVEPYAGKNRFSCTGEAVFREYDDGWRIDSFRVSWE
jgi:hypothetical protein